MITRWLITRWLITRWLASASEDGRVGFRLFEHCLAADAEGRELVGSG
ncbi:MAG: hypothetical protein M5U30_10590 [Burkholderiaceae bacterium]|nr:hypothetical protein [Burkholderiaceae bacterium]